MDAVDTWIPTPDRKEDKPFLMPVEDPVKKLEKLFIAPKVRQVLYETSQRVFTRCACAQRTGFLIKFFNQESVSMAWKSPVKWRLMSSMGITWA